MSTTATTTAKSFLTGLFDSADSFLAKNANGVANIITAVNAPKVAAANAQAAAQAANAQRDANGRLPGEPGYGTNTTPDGITSGTSSLPTWLKPVAIGAGILGGIALLWAIFRRR